MKSIREFMDIVEREQSSNFEWVVPKQGRRAYQEGREVVVWVDVQKIDALWKTDRNFYVPPGGEGDGAIKGRYPRFDAWVKGGEPIEMSEISLGYKGQPSFGNGRHRFAWMRDHGVKSVPVLTPVEGLEEFKRRFGQQ